MAFPSSLLSHLVEHRDNAKIQCFIGYMVMQINPGETCPFLESSFFLLLG